MSAEKTLEEIVKVQNDYREKILALREEGLEYLSKHEDKNGKMSVEDCKYYDEHFDKTMQQYVKNYQRITAYRLTENIMQNMRNMKKPPILYVF